jgi:hypothetical protein
MINERMNLALSPKVNQQPFKTSKTMDGTEEVRTALLEARRVINECLEATADLEGTSSLNKQYAWAMSVSGAELTLTNVITMLRKKFV